MTLTDFEELCTKVTKAALILKRGTALEQHLGANDPGGITLHGCFAKDFQEMQCTILPQSSRLLN